MKLVRKARLIDIAVVLYFALAGILLWIRAWWIAVPLMFLAIYIHKKKPRSGEDDEKREELSNKSLAFGLVLPIGILLILFVYFFFWTVIPTMIRHWQG